MDIQAFPILIKYIEDFITEEESSSLMSFINTIDTSSHKALEGSAASSFTTNDNILDNFINLKEKIADISNKYCIEYGLKSVNIFNSWINIQNKGSILNKHTHPFSVISGALYINKDKDASNLYFHNPNPFLPITEKSDTITPYTCENVSIKAKNNSLILFPSWLSHSTQEPNNMDNRIVLSFNTTIK